MTIPLDTQPTSKNLQKLSDSRSDKERWCKLNDALGMSGLSIQICILHQGLQLLIQAWQQLLFCTVCINFSHMSSWAWLKTSEPRISLTEFLMDSFSAMLKYENICEQYGVSSASSNLLWFFVSLYEKNGTWFSSWYMSPRRRWLVGRVAEGWCYCYEQ